MNIKNVVNLEVKEQKYVLLYAGLKRGEAHYDILDSNGKEIGLSLPYEKCVERCQVDRVHKTKFAPRRSKKRASRPRDDVGTSRVKLGVDHCSIAEFLEFTSSDDFMLHDFVKFDPYF